ncbi:MAG TPA: hypothetical protein VEK32_08765 [Thermodesulfobacteriota bacterium]|nr:hypothetical protein [Thermodesulfobacteriota bacterium]
MVSSGLNSVQASAFQIERKVKKEIRKKDTITKHAGRMQNTAKNNGKPSGVREIEEILMTDPAVAEVCVGGIPDRGKWRR